MHKLLIAAHLVELIIDALYLRTIEEFCVQDLLLNQNHRNQQCPVIIEVSRVHNIEVHLFRNRQVLPFLFALVERISIVFRRGEIWVGPIEVDGICLQNGGPDIYEHEVVCLSESDVGLFYVLIQVAHVVQLLQPIEQLFIFLLSVLLGRVLLVEPIKYIFIVLLLGLAFAEEIILIDGINIIDFILLIECAHESIHHLQVVYSVRHTAIDLDVGIRIQLFKEIVVQGSDLKIEVV